METKEIALLKDIDTQMRKIELRLREQNQFLKEIAASLRSMATDNKSVKEEEVNTGKVCIPDPVVRH